MKINEKIKKALEENNNIITPSQVEELGYSRQLLYKYSNEGLLVRERQGVYMVPDFVHDDMYTLMLKSDYIIFSHETALFLNDLSDRTPFIHSLTIPSTTKLSNVLNSECKTFYIKPELHEIGLVLKENTFGNKVKCYNAERTICDILRSRNRLDDETLITALKKYAVSPNKNLNLLFEYSKMFRVSNILKKYLEVLL